jgi:excinuclease ABC subunit C
MDMTKKLQKVPSSTGIYLLKGAREKVIYVGKAKNLRNRLRSYFQKSVDLDQRKSKMVKEVRGFEYIVAGSELEALVLEANFIKKVKPPYNIILRDDKNYPYLKLTVNEEWPRLEVVRKIEKDGSAYFGPYVPAGSMWELLRYIRRNFPIRLCRYSLEKPFRPCVQLQMNRCLAPCDKSRRSSSDRDEYMEIVNEVRSIIQGENEELLDHLQHRMKMLSDSMEYEEAARTRDRIHVLKKAWELQRVIAPGLGDMDVAGLYREKQEASVFMLFVRNGTIIGQKDFFLKRLGDINDKDLVEGFVLQFYSKEMLIPPRVVVPVRSRFTTQQQWLSSKRGSSVRLSFARGELEKSVLRMADENALYSFNKHKETRVDETLLHIKKLLGLKLFPGKIGAFDVSNISGTGAVGALVMYENGKFQKDEYRLFKIRTVKGTDDFAMIWEIVGRYLKTASVSAEELPRLLLIDGGRGQLESAVAAAGPFDLPIEIVAIAKAKHNVSRKKESGIRSDTDRVYVPGRRSPIYLEPFLASTHLLQKIRDEVHRVAIRYHKKLRTQKTLQSPLEKIQGIGKTRRLLLLKHFGSIDAIRKATLDEIASLKGMNSKVAERLKDTLA